MALFKPSRIVSVLSAVIVVALASAGHAATGAATEHDRASQKLQSSIGMEKSLSANQGILRSVDQDLDTFFAISKTAFDKVAESSALKSAPLATVNNLFMQSLKAYQPWHSLVRTDKKGMAINEVVRIEGVSKEKHSFAKERWFAQTSKTMKECTGVIMTEKTGRYYLIWAAPIVSKVKGVDVFQGAVAAQIDLWDCFDRFADKTTTPFMIRMSGRVTLYDHLWKDTIKHVEKPITVPGVDKIVVRFAAVTGEMTAAAATAAADSAKRELARLDSIRVKAAADSTTNAIKAAKAESRHTAMSVEIVIGALILIVVFVLLARIGRRKNNDGANDKSRFDNL